MKKDIKYLDQSNIKLGDMDTFFFLIFRRMILVSEKNSSHYFCTIFCLTKKLSLSNYSSQLGMCGASVNTGSTDTFNTDTDASGTPVISVHWIIGVPVAPVSVL